MAPDSPSTDRTAPPPAEEPSAVAAGATRPSLPACGLAALWVILPGLQYAGTVERTYHQLGQTEAYPALATLDLTPWFVVLLAATLVYAALRVLMRESKARPAEGAPEACTRQLDDVRTE